MDCHGGKLKECQAAPHHVPAQCGRQVFPQHLVSMLDRDHPAERLHGYIGAEGRDSWNAWLLGSRITTSSVPGTRWILQGLEKNMTRARMSFKPSKSRPLVVKKRRVRGKFHFALSGVTMPSITENRLKSLGKVFDPSLKNSAPIKKATKNLEQVRPSRKIQVLGLLTFHPAQDSVASACLQGPHVNRRVNGDEDQ